MSSKGSKPSKWWFWGVVVGANVYPGVLFVLLEVAHVTGFWAPHQLFMVLFRPAVHLVGWVSSGLLATLRQSPAGVWLAGLLWELGAVALGLACYGVAALVCAVRSRRGKGGDGLQA